GSTEGRATLHLVRRYEKGNGCQNRIFVLFWTHHLTRGGIRMTRPRYELMTCHSALNRVQGMPFRWSLNPYRGCTHGCQYCYARVTHAYFDLGIGRDFEEIIFVKQNLADVLRDEVRRPTWRHETIAIGTATDPYQPA